MRPIKIKRQSRIKESEIVQAIMQYLDMRSDVTAWRQNTGTAMMGSRVVRFGYPGLPDITGIINGGWRLDIEVKASNGIMSDAQKKYQQGAAKRGSCWILATCVSDVVTGLRRFIDSKDGWPRDDKGNPINAGTKVRHIAAKIVRVVQGIIVEDDGFWLLIDHCGDYVHWHPSSVEVVLEAR